MAHALQRQDPHIPDARARKELERKLTQQLKGEVRFLDGDRALYATDSSNYRQVPIGVVVPRDKEDVIEAVKICREFDAPLLTRGGGTSLAGQTCNVAVVLDLSKYLHKVVHLDPEARRARVQPGIVLDYLQKAAKAHGLHFGPDPSTHDNCTIAGMIGNNACGVHSVQSAFAGNGARTSDNLAAMEVLTYDGLRMEVGPTSEKELDAYIRGGGRRGEIYRKLRDLRDRYADAIRTGFPKLPRRVSGFNLDELLPENGFNVARALAGTEGTCVVYLEAELMLISHHPAKLLVVLGYDDVYCAADHVPEYLQFAPDALEGFDNSLMDKLKKKQLYPESVKLFPDGGGWLLVEFGGKTLDEARERAAPMIEHARNRKDGPSVSVYEEPQKQDLIWKAREAGLGATAHVPGEQDSWEGWEDSAVPPENLGNFLRELRALFKKYDYFGPYYGHFGQGLVHTRINFEFTTKEGVGKFRAFTEEAADLVVRHGGSISGEHGDGQSRAEWLGKMYSPELLRAFEEFKAIWDPGNRMNPRKVVHPYRVDENLRLGLDHKPRQPKTHFKFPRDEGKFSYALERCVGVGKCRKTEQGMMCPSYMATREEMHSTRGRTRLLFELMQEDVIGRNGSWRNERVKEALSLCLACKACKVECPVSVDMATYKAEFFSHYYKGRLRPRPAYAMGLIYWWARIASRMPGVTNFFMQRRPFSTLIKKAGGLADQRDMPAFASPTLRKWFKKRPQGENTRGKRVILWPDTFNNFMHTESGQAAVDVLEMLGYRVELPRKQLCCGRPLYDFGMLPTARRMLERVMEELADEIDAGTPIIGIEPSCVAVFRDELVELFPDDERARKLSKQVKILSEFIVEEEIDLPQYPRKALVHMHCHHKSVLKDSAEKKVLEMLGMDFRILDSGCCGLAGSFGFEKENYEVSMACADRVLVPEIRKTDEETLLITNGFSCQEQITHTTGRKAVSLPQVLQMALRSGRRTQDIIPPKNQ